MTQCEDGLQVADLYYTQDAHQSSISGVSADRWSVQLTRRCFIFSSSSNRVFIARALKAAILKAANTKPPLTTQRQCDSIN